jgi:hypothetical protein
MSTGPRGSHCKQDRWTSACTLGAQVSGIKLSPWHHTSHDLILTLTVSPRRTIYKPVFVMSLGVQEEEGPRPTWGSGAWILCRPHWSESLVEPLTLLCPLLTSYRFRLLSITGSRETSFS